MREINKLICLCSQTKDSRNKHDSCCLLILFARNRKKSWYTIEEPTQKYSCQYSHIKITAHYISLFPLNFWLLIILSAKNEDSDNDNNQLRLFCRKFIELKRKSRLNTRSELQWKRKVPQIYRYSNKTKKPDTYINTHTDRYSCGLGLMLFIFMFLFYFHSVLFVRWLKLVLGFFWLGLACRWSLGVFLFFC